MLGLDRANVSKYIQLVSISKTSTTPTALPLQEENVVHLLPTPKKERARKHWDDSIEIGVGNILRTNRETRGIRATRALSGSYRLSNVKALLTKEFPEHGLALDSKGYGMFIGRWKELGEPISALVPWLRFAVEEWSMLRRKHQISRDEKGRQKSEIWETFPNMKNMAFSCKHVHRYYKERRDVPKSETVSLYGLIEKPKTPAEYAEWFQRFQADRRAKAEG